MRKCGCFFFRATTLSFHAASRHISRGRGLVVRCLLFNPEVSCSNPWVCAYFFTSFPKQKVLTFFGTIRLFGFVRLFSKFFKCPQRVFLSFFLKFCNRMDVKKSQRVPLFTVSGIVTFFKRNNFRVKIVFSGPARYIRFFTRVKRPVFFLCNFFKNLFH